MGTAGLWSKFQTHRLALSVERRFDGAVVDAPKCAGRPARIVADFLPRPAAGFRVLDQWGFNRSLSFSRCTLHEGDVTLADEALLELFGQVGLGGCIQREDHEPAGFYVQPMDTHRTLSSGNQMPQAKFGRIMCVFRTSWG